MNRVALVTLRCAMQRREQSVASTLQKLVEIARQKPAELAAKYVPAIKGLSRTNDEILEEQAVQHWQKGGTRPTYQQVNPTPHVLDGEFLELTEDHDERLARLQAAKQPMKPTQQELTPMELIAQLPIVETTEEKVACVGFHPEDDVSDKDSYFGHPIEYIQLNTRKSGDVATCKYCGIRYTHAHD
ncbi:MAG: hypothetical protein MHM6MM_003494 [Cercozoa sp. M6MM]